MKTAMSANPPAFCCAAVVTSAKKNQQRFERYPELYSCLCGVSNRAAK